MKSSRLAHFGAPFGLLVSEGGTGGGGPSSNEAGGKLHARHMMYSQH